MDEAMLKSGQYPNIAIEAGTDPAEVMLEHGREVIPDGEKYELDSREHEPGTRHMDNGVSVQMCPYDTGAHSNVSQNLSDTREDVLCVDHEGNVTLCKIPDTRELLEADVRSEYYGGIESEADEIIGWLDRQAAITRAEVFENGEYDCMTCDAKAELREQVDELTAERDKLKERLERANKSLSTMGIIRLNARIDELEAERDRLQERNDRQGETIDELKAKVDELNANWRKANDGWAEANAEAERLQHANNTLRASVAGLKMTVDKRKPDPVEIQAQLARFADEWERADTRIQEQRLLAYYAGKLANG